MIASGLIIKFELQVDDTTDLSSTEELALLNKIYFKVCSDRPWEFLKKEATGTTSTSVSYIALPSDFEFVLTNYDEEAERLAPVVFVGTDFRPYEIISWSDRRRYRDQDGYCYVDIANSKLYFTKQPTVAEAVEYDYKSTPTALTISATPLIPTRFQDILVHGMAVDDTILQQSDKAKSYAPENQVKYKGIFDDMCYWDANLKQ
jgi:hypothetical protein